VYKLADGQSIKPHEVLSINPVANVVVTLVGTKNTDKLVYETNTDILRKISQLLGEKKCPELLTDTLLFTQVACNLHAFNFRTFEDTEIPFYGACIGLDVGSLLAPIVFDLGTMPLQMACGEWFESRVQLYEHLRGVNPDEYEYLLDIDNKDDAAISRPRRGVLGPVLKGGEHMILKLVKPVKIFDTVLTTVAKKFKGPTGKVLTEETMDAIKVIMKTEQIASDPMFKMTEYQFKKIVKKYLTLPENIVKVLDGKRFLSKPEKISLVKEAFKKYGGKF